jgi:hypothetical protein
LEKNAPLQLDWEILVGEVTGESFLSADLEPYRLFANSDYSWWVGEEREDCEELVEVAGGMATSLVTAMVAAEAAVRKLKRKNDRR